MSTRPTHRITLASLAIAATTLVWACKSQAVSDDEELYERYLENHETEQWVELTPETVKELLDPQVPATAQAEIASDAQAHNASPAPPPSPAPAAAEGGTMEGATAEEATDEPAAALPPAIQAAGASAPMLEFRDIPLKDLVRLVARDMGLDVLVPDSLTQTVTVSLRSTDPLAALQSVLKTHGFQLEPQQNGLTVVAPIPAERASFETRTFTLTSTPVTAVGETLKKLLSSEGKLVINTDGTSFIMLDRPENIRLMEEYVRILDVRERQVLVEANLVEITLEKEDEVGVLLEALNISIDDTTSIVSSNLLPSSDNFTVGVAANKTALFGLLQALASERYIRLRSAPKVATMNSQAASIEVIERIPYVKATTTTTATTDGQGITAIEQIEFEEVGVWLKVTPTIGEDRMIKMEIEPQVKELTGFFKGVPVVDSRRVKTTVMVHDGETVVIGGLIRQDKIKVTDKVPILGDIPLLGFFFTRTASMAKKTSLWATVTPRILSSDATLPPPPTE
ncbi:MAG: secretin N-terminal domain-containing protein [Planctomycetota bacterium]